MPKNAYTQYGKACFCQTQRSKGATPNAMSIISVGTQCSRSLKELTDGHAVHHDGAGLTAVYYGVLALY